MDRSFELSRAIKAKSLKRVERLLTSGVVPNANCCFLAIDNQSHKILKRLLQERVDLETVNFWGFTPLVKALKNQDCRSAELLLNAGASPNTPSNFGPPLIYAATQGFIDGVKLLIKAGTDLEQRDSSQATSLIRASRMGHLEIVQLLINSGANPKSVDESERTAYDWAVKEGQHVIAQLLAPMSSRRPQVPSRAEMLVQAISKNNKTVFRGMLASGIDVNAPGKFGQLPLLKAIDRNSRYFVSELLKAGAKINVIDPEGISPLELCVRQWKPEMARLLLSKGADPNGLGEKGSDPILTVCAMGSSSLTRVFLERGANPNAANLAGITALMKAASARSLATMQLLTESGAKLEEIDLEGKSALFYAIEVPLSAKMVTRTLPIGVKAWMAVPTSKSREPWVMRRQIVKFLLAQGADPNRRDAQGRTPLTYDVSAETANDLLRAGARTDIRDKAGHDVAYWLKRNGLSYALDLAPEVIVSAGSTTNKKPKTVSSQRLPHCASSHKRRFS